MNGWTGRVRRSETTADGPRRAGALAAFAVVALGLGSATWTESPNAGAGDPAVGPTVADPWQAFDLDVAVPGVPVSVGSTGAEPLCVEGVRPATPSGAIMALHFIGSGRDSCSGTALPPPC
jgi:hypothetical protein